MSKKKRGVEPTFTVPKFKVGEWVRLRVYGDPEDYKDDDYDFERNAIARAIKMEGSAIAVKAIDWRPHGRRTPDDFRWFYQLSGLGDEWFLEALLENAAKPKSAAAGK
jgi:hypothetical protein